MSEPYQELPETVPNGPIRDSKSGVQVLSFKVSPGMTHQTRGQGPSQISYRIRAKDSGEQREVGNKGEVEKPLEA